MYMNISIANMRVYYAVDNILSASTLTALRSLLISCEDELYDLDISVISSKTKRFRFVTRYKNICRNIMFIYGNIFERVGF